MSVAFPLLRLVNPAGVRTFQSKVSIGDVGLSKPELHPQPALLRTRPGVEKRGGRGPMDNLALRLHPGRVPVRRGAENRKARELTRNPAAGRPLVVNKRNRRAERKRASKVLQLPLALNNANLNLD